MISKEIEMPPGPSLGSKIMDGAIWNTFQLLAARGTALIVQLILARLLLPEHFGIVGMAAVFIDIIGAVGDLGLAAALIQFKRDKLTDHHLDTAFWVSLAFNGLIFLLFVFAIGPLAAWFYGEPLLRVVLPIAGAENLIRSVGLIQRVILTRELRFKPLGIVEAVASVLSGIVAIAAALAGAGVWSLIIKDLGFVAVSLPLLWFAVRWRPRFRFFRTAFKDIFRVGVFDTLQRLFLFVTANIDYLLIGKLLGPELLGIYTLAFVLTSTFRQQIWRIMTRVMFPVYAQVQNDLSRVKEYYLKVVKYNTISVTPLMVLFIFFAEPIIRIIWGENWLPAALPLRIMAVSAIVTTIGGTTDSVLKGLGKFNISFRLTVLNVLFVGIPAFAIGIYFFGINGAAFAVLIHQTVTRIIYQREMRKLAQVYESDILEAIKTPMLGVLATLPIVLYFGYLLPSFTVLTLILASAAICLVYGITVFLLNKVEFIKLYQLLAKRQAQARAQGIARNSR